MSDLIGSLDRAVGDGLERLVWRHHRRRLRRIGWEGALNPGAGIPARADPPARAGNRLEVLVDGEEALPAIASEIRAARSHVHIAGWHVASGFALTRDHPQAVVRELLAEVATRVPVRVLVWAGAPVPLFHPKAADDGEDHRADRPLCLSRARAARSR
jgi:phosphatidylserine/phosphatidylglycerophosphate/cardiolipin synthase-like enzyme